MGQRRFLANTFNNTVTDISLKPYQNILKRVKFRGPRCVFHRDCIHTHFQLKERGSVIECHMRISDMSYVPPVPGYPSCISSTSPQGVPNQICSKKAFPASQHLCCPSQCLPSLCHFPRSGQSCLLSSLCRESLDL